MVQVYGFSYLFFLINNWLFKVRSLFPEGLDTMISLKAFQLNSYLYHIKNLIQKIVREGIQPLSILFKKFER